MKAIYDIISLMAWLLLALIFGFPFFVCGFAVRAAIYGATAGWAAADDWRE